jgi:L,D-peptidoglycan transpeptidase YkuD (ErfK/YbiS/YcfS/YnhG family)
MILRLNLEKTGLVPVFLLFLSLLAACSHKPEDMLSKINLPLATTQVLLVTTSGWNSSDGILRRMEKKQDGWHSLGEAIPVKVGRNGLGWGLGLHANTAGVQKLEGDGKAPAGIFPLGMAFGYAEIAPAGLQMPYRIASERDYFVDAVDSPDYNHWRHLSLTQANEPQQHWSSFERMHRDDDQYEYGMIVGHNMMPTVSGRGSAIFLHVWLSSETATSGCTAMSKESLLEVLRWLKLSANPLLIQAPQDEVGRLLYSSTGVNASSRQ